jgi:diadenosine tetraphosphatase ApaH/serine/threonine PP2A family protein phosphatase
MGGSNAMLALLADIHSNLEALNACLEHARSSGATRYALLGDFVGYGPDPGAVVEIAMRMAGEGAVVVKGNHDEAVEHGSLYLNEAARAAIAWTQGELHDRHKAFLTALPLVVREDTVCFVHASAEQPARWTYVDGPSAARRCMDAAGLPYAFVGHVHDQQLFFENPTGRFGAFRPTPGTSIPVPRVRRWLGIAGSVGQPRDGDPRAAYALLDTRGERLVFHRVPYDHMAVAGKMRRAGLPAALINRIERGA